jgi:hypothetical protein
MQKTLPGSNSSLKSPARRWAICAVLLATRTIPAQSPGMQLPGAQLPGSQVPDESAPGPTKKPHPISNKQASDKLRKDFNSKNAAYAGSNIRAAVDDQTITLTGSVASETQHEMALQLAKAYADDRKIVDQLVIQQ